jgi:hypothetical protein
VEPARLTGIAEGAWDLVLSAFTFDYIPLDVLKRA